jgi:hypothetical protein
MISFVQHHATATCIHDGVWIHWYFGTLAFCIACFVYGLAFWFGSGGGA